MEFTKLGRTGLRVSRMGLGCGGHSRLGQSTGRTVDESVGVVREALSLGINFIDTAEAYGTEEIVGRAVRGLARDQFIVSTKVGVERDGRRASAAEYRDRVIGCLERLGLEFVDVLHIHGLSAFDYPYAKETIVPVLEQLKVEGKIRFMGVTEAFAPDPGHQMFSLAAEDDFWDVIMVGFNILNQSARQRVLPWAQAEDVGTLGMFAVRRALSNLERRRVVFKELAEAGLIEESLLESEDPLGFLVADGVAASVTEAAYRFCLWEPGLDVVLSGTGSIEHLRENVVSLSQPPLPLDISGRLRTLFAKVDTVSGN